MARTQTKSSAEAPQLKKKKSSDDKKTLSKKPAPTETTKRKKDEDELFGGTAKKAKVRFAEPLKDGKKEKEQPNAKAKGKAKDVKEPKKKSAKSKALAPPPESDSESEEEVPQPKNKSNLTNKSAPSKQSPKLISANANAKLNASSIVKSTKTKQKAKSPSPTPSESDEEVTRKATMDDEDDGGAENNSEGGKEEQIHLHGFSTDEDDSSDDEAGGDDKLGLSAFEISKLPTVAKDDESVKRRLEKAKRQPTDDVGVVYIGRLPHGFYEDQLKGYFSQFGDITRLRISRNKKTGKSKHYGFIEFDSSSVAQIVAETMDNYLLSGHILKCKLIPKDEVHPELWIGANRKWRVVPRSRIVRVQHNKPRTEEQQVRANKRLIKRQNERKRKLEAMGIEYDFNAVSYKRPKADKKA